MPQQNQDDPVAKALAGAKGFLKEHPADMSKADPPRRPAPAPTPKPSSMGEEAKGAADMVQKAKTALNVSNAPKMHKGGPVKKDGIYSLQAGEHVLTADEAQMARKHAIMASGMKSLSKPGAKANKK